MKSFPGRPALLGRMRDFGRDESGVMIAYSIFFFLIMLIVAGIGVDFMHFEMKRTRLQNTLDRAVLAAADIEQTLDAQYVVEDYLAKAGVDATLSGAPVVDSGVNYRDVTAGATLTVPTQFIHMLGFDTLTAPAVSQAEERIEGIEIALVLDISGSMNRNNRLVNLKPAAHEFVDTMMALGAPGDVAISIVPYNTQVNAGETLLDYYSVSNEHDYSHCVTFDAADFSDAALSPSQSLERAGHFDIWSNSQGPAQTNTLRYPVCPTRPGTEITVMGTDATALKNKITALSAYGNTSIDVGMKWGAALLDPGTRPVITEMITDTVLDPVNAGRPLNHGEPGVLKVIVVMTDGQNTVQYRLPPHLRSGPSGVTYNTEATDADLSDRYSIWDAGLNQFFWVRDGSYHDEAYGNEGPGPDNAVALTHPQLMAMNSQNVIADEIFAPKIGTTQARNDWYDSVTGSAETHHSGVKDARLQDICAAVKDEQVVIYAIGFEATANGNAQLTECATSPTHFYAATGGSIGDVFNAIALSITQLKLTQ